MFGRNKLLRLQAGFPSSTASQLATSSAPTVQKLLVTSNKEHQAEPCAYAKAVYVVRSIKSLLSHTMNRRYIGYLSGRGSWNDLPRNAVHGMAAPWPALRGFGTTASSTATQLESKENSPGGAMPTLEIPPTEKNTPIVHQAPTILLQRSSVKSLELDSPPEEPPWLVPTEAELSNALRSYRQDLQTTRSSTSQNAGSSSPPTTSPLPFLEQAVTEVVGGERELLSSSLSAEEASSNARNHTRREAMSASARRGFALSKVMKVAGVTSHSRNSNVSPSQTLATATHAMAKDAMDEESANQSHKTGTILATTPPLTRMGSNKSTEPRPTHDEAQARLASQANAVISVLTSIECLIPLAPWQRRSVSHAIVGGFPLRSWEGGLSSPRQDCNPDAMTPCPNQPHALHPHPPSQSPLNVTTPNPAEEDRIISPYSAWATISFLLRDCGLSHRQCADLIAQHPWALALGNPAVRCLPLLESLSGLLDMNRSDIAAIISAHPAALLADAEAEVLPLLEYLSSLGLSESETAALLRQHPRLLDRGARQRLAASVAFWVGRGMPRDALQRLLMAVPEISAMGQQLVQLKVDWMAEYAGFDVVDFAQAPDVLRLPLTTVVAPRIAFARHLGYDVLPPPSSAPWHGPTDAAPPSPRADDVDELTHGVCTMQTSARPFVTASDLLAGSESAFLSLLGTDISDAEFRAFEAAWCGSDFRLWLARRSPGELSHYEGLEWMEEAELMQLREMHDRHVALREIAWEQQQDREKEWQVVWKEWRKEQKARDAEVRKAQRAAEKRETEAMRRATLQMALAMEQHRGGDQGESSTRDISCTKSIFCSHANNHQDVCNREYGGGGVLTPVQRRRTIEASAKAAAIAAVAVGSGDPLSALGIERPPPPIDDVECKQTFSLEELMNQPITEVRRCAAGIEALLRAAPGGVAAPLMIDGWAKSAGYSCACISAAKGLLASSGIAWVVAEPGWRYHKVHPRVWQLLMRDDDGEVAAANGLSEAWQRALIPRRMTKGAESVMLLSSLLLRSLHAAPGKVMSRRGILDWARGQSSNAVAHARHAVAALIEQGMVVQRRRRGMASGPMEVTLLDLSRYTGNTTGERVGEGAIPA